MSDLEQFHERDQLQEAVGVRLRSIRRQQGLSLHDVQTRSGAEFKKSVLGAYERGERAISMPRLLRLAQLYGVPPDLFLAGDKEAGFAVDLERLTSAEDGDATVLRQFVEWVQIQRQDFKGGAFTIRNEDMRFLATVLGHSQQELEQHLEQLGLRANVAGP